LHGIQFVDIPIPVTQRVPIRFTFFWLDDQRWEGADYVMQVKQEAAKPPECGKGIISHDGRAGTSNTLKPSAVGV
jgi:hypothetical protein